MEILKLNHTSLTTVIMAYRASTTISLEGIVTAAKLEYQSALAGGRWVWNELIQKLGGASKKDKDESDQVLALRAEIETIKKSISKPNASQSNSQTDRPRTALAPQTNLTQN